MSLNLWIKRQLFKLLVALYKKYPVFYISTFFHKRKCALKLERTEYNSLNKKYVDLKDNDLFEHISNIGLRLCMAALAMLIVLPLVLNDFNITLYMVGISIFWIIIPDLQLLHRYKQHQIATKKYFPIFLQTLSLLLSSGMDMSSALNEATLANRSILPIPFKALCRELSMGRVYYEAISLWSSWLPSTIMSKFVVLITQCGREGLKEVSSSLITLSDEALKEQHYELKKIAETASTKMLAPLLISMACIMFIMVYPIMSQFQGF